MKIPANLVQVDDETLDLVIVALNFYHAAICDELDYTSADSESFQTKLDEISKVSAKIDWFRATRSSRR